MSARRSWWNRHCSDYYVKQAKTQGYASRAAYKLLAIQNKDRIFRPGMTVLDLGAAPGGWSQVAIQCLRNRGKVFALDKTSIKPISGVTFIQGDLQEPSIFNRLLVLLAGMRVDVLISDISPNLSGYKSTDQARLLHLLEFVWCYAERCLKPDGCFLVKVFQGEGIDLFIKKLSVYFSFFKSRKPEASRSCSREFYLLGKGFKPGDLKKQFLG